MPAGWVRAGWSLLLLGLAVLALVWQREVAQPWHFSRAFLPNRAQFFALGIASRTSCAADAGAVGHYLAVLGAALALCAADGRPEKLLPPLVWTLCLAAQACPQHHWALRAASRALRQPVLLRLGLWSYGIYLANEPIQKALGVALTHLAGGNAGWFTAVWVPASIALPVLAAAWLHRVVEVPAARIGRAFALARSPAMVRN